METCSDPDALPASSGGPVGCGVADISSRIFTGVPRNFPSLAQSFCNLSDPSVEAAVWPVLANHLTSDHFSEIVGNQQSAFNMIYALAARSNVEPRSVPDVVYQWLRERILLGGLRPGEEIRQELLAKQFGTSRVPIREALSRLQAEGLIVLRPRRGFAVLTLKQEDIIEIFELRMAIEEHAMLIANKERTEADIRDVEALVERMETLDPAAPGFLQDWMSANRLFHSRLIECAHRKRVSEIALNLRDSIEPYIRTRSKFLRPG